MGSYGERVAAKSIQHEKSLEVYSDGGDVKSWVGLLRNFGPLTDTPPVPKVGDILTEKTAFRLPSGSIVMADRSAAINKIDIAFYVSGSCLPTWDALQRYVRYEPIRVVRVGWSS